MYITAHKFNVGGESDTLQVIQPDLTFGLLALAFFVALGSSSVDGLRNNSVGVGWDDEASGASGFSVLSIFGVTLRKSLVS